jgi:pyruvate,water dikinase
LVAAREQTLTELGQRLPVWQAAAIVRLLSFSLKAIQNREAGRMQQSILFGELRGAVRRAGELLAKRGVLGSGDDVFFCTLSEIDALARNALPDHEAMPEAILRRKREHLALRERFPPSAFLLPAAEALPAPGPGASVPEAASSVLRGLTVSRGTTEGIARVVRDPSAGDTLEPGQILVASSTDPGWTPLFMLASGLILERGGMLSHGAIVAREMDIPALVGVKDACTRIKNGAQLRLDANSGVVELSTP